MRKRPDLYFPLAQIRPRWLFDAAQLSGKCLHVALALAFKACLAKSDTVHLSPWLLAEFGIGERALRQCLRQLENAKLVRVVRSPGTKARATLLSYRRSPGEKVRHLEVVK